MLKNKNDIILTDITNDDVLMASALSKQCKVVRSCA